MVNVGVRQLKNSLSQYLRAVREGEIVLITERGRVVAEIRRRASADEDVAQAMTTAEREGILTRGRGRMGRAPPMRLPRGVRASALVVEDRGD
jgi:prevent-host-death family protein